MQKITFTTVKRGKWSKKQTATALYLDLTNKYKSDHITDDFAGQIAVQSVYSTGTGSDYKEEPQERALINITFPDDTPMWSGTFQELQAALTKTTK